MVDDSPIYFFGNAVVKAAIAGLHVKHRNAATSRADSRESTIGISQKQYAFRLISFHLIIYLAQDLTGLVAKAFRPDAQMYIRCSHLEIADKNIAQRFVVILAGVDGRVFGVLVENLENQTEPDYLGPRPEYGHYFHKEYRRRQEFRY
jgi:hypothetical protein